MKKRERSYETDRELPPNNRKNKFKSYSTQRTAIKKKLFNHTFKLSQL